MHTPPANQPRAIRRHTTASARQRITWYAVTMESAGGNSGTGTAANLRIVGERLRAGRLRSGLTVAGAARASGLSTGFISLLENGKTDATVGRLNRLVEAFGMSIADAVGPTHAEPSHQPNGQVLQGLASYVSSEERLVYSFFDPADSGLLPVHVLIEPSGGWLNISVHQGEETIFGLRGRVEVQDGDAVVEVGPGDRYRIPPLAPHTLRAVGEEAVELFVLVRDPYTLNNLDEAEHLHRQRPT